MLKSANYHKTQTAADGNVSSFADIWQLTKVLHTFWPDCGAKSKVRGSHPIVLKIFPSVLPTDWLTDIAIDKACRWRGLSNLLYFQILISVLSMFWYRQMTINLALSLNSCICSNTNIISGQYFIIHGIYTKKKKPTSLKLSILLFLWTPSLSLTSIPLLSCTCPCTSFFLPGTHFLFLSRL